MINSYKDLTVWQKSYGLSLLIYRLTRKFPKEELYGLTSQIRRCVVSIPSNIAEGFIRYNKANDLLQEVMKMLNSLIRRLKSTSA